jgi:hypothetical protein
MRLCLAWTLRSRSASGALCTYTIVVRTACKMSSNTKCCNCNDLSGWELSQTLLARPSYATSLTRPNILYCEGPTMSGTYTGALQCDLVSMRLATGIQSMKPHVTMAWRVAHVPCKSP